MGAIPEGALTVYLRADKVAFHTIPISAKNLDTTQSVPGDHIARWKYRPTDQVFSRAVDKHAAARIAQGGGARHIGADEVPLDYVVPICGQNNAMATEAIDDQAADRAASAGDNESVYPWPCGAPVYFYDRRSREAGLRGSINRYRVCNCR